MFYFFFILCIALLIIAFILSNYAKISVAF